MHPDKEPTAVKFLDGLLLEDQSDLKNEQQNLSSLYKIVKEKSLSKNTDISNVLGLLNRGKAGDKGAERSSKQIDLAEFEKNLKQKIKQER